jgi:co-chaperonin GroES (HSP10)
VVEELKRTQTKGGIVFPEGAGDPQGYGKVLSVGDQVSGKQIKTDDIIVFHARGGQAVLLGKRLLRVLKYDEIYGLLEDKDLLESLAEMQIAGVNADGTVEEKKDESRIIHPVS